MNAKTHAFKLWITTDAGDFIDVEFCKLFEPVTKLTVVVIQIKRQLFTLTSKQWVPSVFRYLVQILPINALRITFIRFYNLTVCEYI